MGPEIIPLFLLAIAVGAGLFIIGKQGAATEGTDQDPSSNPSN